MNILLIPYNWTRQVVLGFFTASVPVLIWLLFTAYVVGLGPSAFQAGLLFIPEAEGPLLFGLMAGGIAAVHLFAEGTLRRRATVWQVVLVLAAFLVAGLFAGGLVFGIEYAMPFIADGLMKTVDLKTLSDPGLVVFRMRFLEWLVAGVVVGVTTLALRLIWSFMGPLSKLLDKDKVPEMVWRFAEVPQSPPRVSVWMGINHLLAGVSSAAIGAGVWQVCSYLVIGDMFLSSILGFGTWGLVFGLLAWGVPDDLYAGWIRVLSSSRYGFRIPIDATAGGPVERIVGHYPRGLDLIGRVDAGVAELHTSFVVDQDGRYAVRGLSIQECVLKRSLERIDLTYDPRSPVPLEADLRSGDRVLIGPSGKQTLVEFIMLAKEEQ